MKRFSILLLLCIFYSSSFAQSQEDSYQQFRKGLLNNYQDFRKSVIDNYSSYLEDVWKKYETFTGNKRNPHPKPKKAPDVNTTPPNDPSKDTPIVIKPKEKDTSIVPSPKPTPLPSPSTPTTPTLPQYDDVSFPFYGVVVKVPRLECLNVGEFTPQNVSKIWKKYNDSNNKISCKELNQKVKLLGINDWFTFELVRSYVNFSFKTSNAIDRIVLQHFVLVNLGYDIRIAQQDGEPILLVAIEETIYNRSYIKIDGVNYYVYDDNNNDGLNKGGVYTCDLPSNLDLGKRINMIIKSDFHLSSSEKHHCQLSWKDMILNIDVDKKQMEMLRHYPPMDIHMYASSTIKKSVRQSVLDQLKPFIQGLSVPEAANKLLNFVQFAFDYATDQDQHGYEKSYFFEENFYYPKNDCEDRAIFYAYLVRYLLGLDVVLVQYPGHECTAVNFSNSNIQGDALRYNGKRFIICDPTYIGASIGQCMPQYQNVVPVRIDEW